MTFDCGTKHIDQPNNPIWIKIRQYNCLMLVRIIEALQRVPEGSGTMMDYTLIVYTSDAMQQVTVEERT